MGMDEYRRRQRGWLRLARVTQKQNLLRHLTNKEHQDDKSLCMDHHNAVAQPFEIVLTCLKPPFLPAKRSRPFDGKINRLLHSMPRRDPFDPQPVVIFSEKVRRVDPAKGRPGRARLTGIHNCNLRPGARQIVSCGCPDHARADNDDVLLHELYSDVAYQARQAGRSH